MLKKCYEGIRKCCLFVKKTIGVLKEFILKKHITTWVIHFLKNKNSLTVSLMSKKYITFVNKL